MDNFVNNKSDDKKPKLLDQVRQIYNSFKRFG